MSIENQPIEHHEKPIPYKESLELAKELYACYVEKIRENSCKDVDNWGDPYTDFQKSIPHFLSSVPEEVLERYQGHGITRNSSIDQLAAALNILSNKSIKGECGLLAGGKISGYNARKDGDFLVISKFAKGLPITEEREGRQQLIFNEIGWQADIGAFVIDVHYYPLVDELKKMFPDVNIIKANELPDYFNNIKQ